MAAHDRRGRLRPQARRLWDTLQGELPDRVPRQELFFHNPAIETHVIGQPIDRVFERSLDFARQIGWGSARATSWGTRIGARNEVASDGTSHYAGGSAVTREDLDELGQGDPAQIADQHAHHAEMIHAEGLLSHIFMLHCFHSAATGMGMERLCLMVYDQPDLLREYMQRVEAYNRRVLRAVLDTGVAPDIAIFDADCAFKTALMVSPAAYRELIFEPTKATCDMLRDAGITIMMHTDGKIDDVYPVWLEMGMVGAHGVEKQANDLAETKRRFGDRMTLFGNFDPVVLATETPERIRDMAREMVQVGKPGGRYVAAVNTIVGENVPVANYLAFIDGVEEAAANDTATGPS
ncbi:MAG: uroporphyrinogen decarboxylase family protein [Armatimonadota bacterium]|nr:uroporphyrinogen decarboxylase family protein [Armatimonadota bacterium]